MMDVKAKIRAFIAENFLFSLNGFDLSDDDSFLDEGVVDSTGTLELVMFAEEAFGITVSDVEIEPNNFDSVNKLAAYITLKMGSMAALGDG